MSRRDHARAGFTLIEALVALAIVLAFATTIVPFMFHARRIVMGTDDRLAALALLRSLIDAPIDRAGPGNATRSGKYRDLTWSIKAEPLLIDALPVARDLRWVPMRVVVSVAWGRENVISAETVRLSRAN